MLYGIKKSSMNKKIHRGSSKKARLAGTTRRLARLRERIPETEYRLPSLRRRIPKTARDGIAAALH